MTTNSFIILRKFSLFKFNREFEIRKSDSDEIIIQVVERTPGLINKFFRFFNFGGNTPFALDFFSRTGERWLTIEKGLTWFLSKVIITSNQGCIGILKENLYRQGDERFTLLDSNENELYSIRFEQRILNYKLVTNENVVYARVTRESKEVSDIMRKFVKNGFLLKALYFVTIDTEVSTNQLSMMLLLASVVGLDLTIMRQLDESQPTG